MTAVEHIVTWIESSAPHYNRLLVLEQTRKASDKRRNRLLASEAFLIAADAYSEMVRGGDAYMGEHTPETILDAAKALLAWELEA
jgi:hypothetical protein